MIRKEIQHLAVPITDLTPHPKNVRQGDIGAISESLKQHGQYRPIVVQKSTGHILAGNHTYKAAKALKWKEIAVTYVDCDNEQATRILLMDNRANDLASYDEPALIELLKELAQTEDQLFGTSFELDDLDRLIETIGFEDQQSTTEHEPMNMQSVIAPQYQITGEQPALTDLFDDTVTRKLQKQIDLSRLPPDLKEFLHLAAHRHTVFRYNKIAEYFAHADKETQELMRESVLVIIDFNDAARLGYVKFKANIDAMYEEDSDEE